MVGIGSPQGSDELTDSQARERLVMNLAEWIARRGMTAPVTLLLELLRPLGFVGSQCYLLAEPLLGARTRERVRPYAALFEDTACVEHLLEALQNR
ncbi:MAG: hypothetical protein FJZ90_02760 [Chloroflexi bacterium]|nr:hypothetical protein [Chloroflexota bacterium]